MENTLSLVKQAIVEWYKGELTDKECLNIITVLISIEKPPKEAIEWATQVALSLEDNHPVEGLQNEQVKERY